MDRNNVNSNNLATPHRVRTDWHYHLLGIGGIGMSGIAGILHRRGVGVSGSDTGDGPVLRELASVGIPVHADHRPEGLREADAVVYSSAISSTHPIWKEVESRGLPRLHRAEMLGALASGGKTLAVTGTHGKTTTTAALGYALIQSGKDPTVLVGGIVPQLEGRNFRAGEGEWFVCEADESDASFLHLSPDAILLTNAEADHLDFHGSAENVRAAFRSFLHRLPEGGVLVYCADDPAALALGTKALGAGAFGAGTSAAERTYRAISYGSGGDAQVGVRVEKMDGAGMRLALRREGEEFRLATPLIGRHNALNLCGAFALACQIGLGGEEAAKALEGFQGVERRQQFLGRVGGLALYDDYAHHPTEIRATLACFQEIRSDPLTVVFQPHLYSRTAQFAMEFAEALRPADRVYVTDIYGAREAPMEGISGQLVMDHLAGHPAARFVPDWKEMVQIARKGEIPDGVLLTLGAGDITGLGPLLLRTLS